MPRLLGLRGGFREIPTPLKIHLSISYFFFMMCSFSAFRSLLVVIERPKEIIVLPSFGLSIFYGVSSYWFSYSARIECLLNLILFFFTVSAIVLPLPLNSVMTAGILDVSISGRLPLLACRSGLALSLSWIDFTVFLAVFLVVLGPDI